MLHLDLLQLEIIELDEASLESSIQSLTLFTIPTEIDLNSEDIPKKLVDDIVEINQNPTSGSISGYELTDTRRVTEMGASAVTQEIVLSIVTGAAEGVAGVLIYKFSNWLLSKYKGRSTKETTIDEEIDRVKRMVVKYFNPHGRLDAIEITELKISLTDTKGAIYEAKKIENNPDSVNVRRI